MCTLTYLPVADGFAMLSSRDEMRGRGAMRDPVQDELRKAIYPVDEQSGGTWMLTSAKGFSLNLLNGGHERHVRKEPYRHSRGLVPLMFAEAGSLAVFLDRFDPLGVEPFTLVVVEHSPVRVMQLVWTGAQLDIEERSPTEPAIWSSSTLYNTHVRHQRTAWFTSFLAEPMNGTPMEKLMRFHREGGVDRAPLAERIRMRRTDGPETVCLAGIEYDAKAWRFVFHDLVRDRERRMRMIG
jgi:hypothetical protein